MSRFDYVKYDEQSQKVQSAIKEKFQELEALIDAIEAPAADRSKYLAKTRLEESYMWVGKAVRDDQIHRNVVAPLQEERTNS